MPPAEKDRPGKVFVGGMSSDTVEETIQSKFAKFGKISEVILVRNKETNISRGFGFITYADPADADTAVKEMNGFVLEGKSLKVDSALKALHSHDSRGRGRGGGRGGPMARGGSRGGFGRGGPPPLMRRGMSGPQRGGPPRGGPSRGGPPRGGPPHGGPPHGGPRGRGGLLGDGRSMMMRGRGGPGMGRSNGPRSGGRSDGPPGRPGFPDHEQEGRPSRSRGGFEDSYGPPSRPGGDRGLLSTPHHYEEEDYGPPVKRSRPESSYPSQSAEEYPPARGGYGQEENGYGNHRAPEYLAERPSKHLYGRPPAREYGESRAELPPRDPVQPRDSVLGRTPRYEYGEARPEAVSRDRPREPAAPSRGYPPSREAPRDYPPRERDQYAARPSYTEPAANRESYPTSRRDPPTASRGYGASGYEERDYTPRTDAYERTTSSSYSREFPTDSRPPARPARPAYPDPYAEAAPAKDYGTQARGRPSSSYSAPRDSFTEARAERPRMDYGARDPFAASAEAARGGARRPPPASRGFERY